MIRPVLTRDPVGEFPVASKMSPSLTARLLRGLIAPLAVVAVLLGVSGAWAVEEAVEAVNDRVLAAASRAIAESLSVEEGQITLDLPVSAFGMLENNARDNVYYNVVHRGVVLTGYADLPRVDTSKLRDGEIAFAKKEYRGQRVRIVVEARRLPRVGGLVYVHVAETMEARNRVLRPALIGLFIIEGVLVLLGVALVPVAVRWGLRPLGRLQREMDAREASDFTPLPLGDVPAELLDLVKAFNALLARLDLAVEGVKRFTADASHQMRTPLSILRTHISVLRNARPGSDDALASIDDIDEASRRLQHLLVQLLALARAESNGSAHVLLEPVDLNVIARQQTAEHAGQAVETRVDLTFEPSRRPAIALAHPVLAAELLANFIDNALRYNGHGGMVAVAVKTGKGKVRVTIEDDGPGIAPEDRERVFTRFTRLDRDQSRAGSGLGLSIARALADSMGAEVRLNARRSGPGLCVTVSFAEEDATEK